MRETIRKLKKLGRTVATGKTECRHCDHVVRTRNPFRALVELGRHGEYDACGEKSMEEFMREKGASETEIAMYREKRDLAERDHPRHRHTNESLCSKCYKEEKKRRKSNAGTS